MPEVFGATSAGGAVPGTEAPVPSGEVQNNAGALTAQHQVANACSRSVSGVNAAQAVTLDTGRLCKSLAVHSAASGGTANLTVEVSVDNVNFLTLDTIAAAATVVKQYVEATVGAGIALSPLAFRYVKITAGAAGAGNTTTLTVAAK